jgi:hypothetical protein
MTDSLALLPNCVTALLILLKVIYQIQARKLLGFKYLKTAIFHGQQRDSRNLTLR